MDTKGPVLNTARSPPSTLNFSPSVAFGHLSSPSSGDEQKLLRRVTPLYQVQLEKVLGLTVASNAALDCDTNTGTIAYPAGCTVVLYNPRKNRQHHVQNLSRKTVTCVTFSACGRYIATGECGHQPFVRVWDALDRTTQLAEFQGHKYGVSCVAFSPIQNYVVSVGSQHDMIVNVWDWKSGVKIASNKFSSKVKAVSFAENGSYFVTVGNRHVKFWYLEVARGSKFKEPVPLTGRSAILGEQRNNYFCDVACGRGEMGDSTFAITKSGLLCEFNNRRLLDKWVELRTTSANCLVVGEHYIFVGCGEAIVRCFNPYNLQFITTLPRTHYLGVDVSLGLNIKHMGEHPAGASYPDTVAVAYDPLNSKLTAVYNDHSLYVWDVTDIKRVGKSHSFLYHSACIWGVENYPDTADLLPQGSFITCSSDDTIRIWNIAPEIPPHPTVKRNIYSNELLRVLYVDSELTLLKDTDISPAGQGGDKGSSLPQQQTDASYDSRNGVRCIKISADGRHIASGDRAGNIRIHEVQQLEEICKIEAHDAEVLCLEYSSPDTRQSLLASASRDRLIHVFDVNQEYSFLQTLDDHSSAITCVRFYRGPDSLQMVSCSADRSIIFRNAQLNTNNEINFNRSHNIAGKATLYDMEVDFGQRHILTACQDRNIRVYNVKSGKLSKTFRGAAGDDGSLIKVVLDDSGIYAATSCTDKNMSIYDYYSGDCLATMYGHSELVTGLRFSNDGQHLISVSGDGCIFLWRLPREMSQTIAARKAQQSERASREVSQKPVSTPDSRVPISPASTPDLLDARPMEDPQYRFNVGQLPGWAKKKVREGYESSPGSGPAGDVPKGRWAQRVPTSSSITFKSHYDTDSVISIPAPEKLSADTESSKESSLEGANARNNNQNMSLISNSSGKSTEADHLHAGRRSAEPRFTRPVAGDDSDGSSLRVDGTTTDHDGDVEDCSEQDDTEPEQHHHTMYYPHSEDTAVSEFQVNAMDIEELRRSQRRQRTVKAAGVDLSLSSRDMTLPLSQDSDDEDVSTPSADNADRTILSMLSCESVDKLGRRESFMKSNYESLDADNNQNHDRDNKNSISYRFNARHKDNIPITATSSSSSLVSNKREELQKKIEETRKKLQSIGYKSSLRSSKSISDLSNLPDKENSFMSLGGGLHNTTMPDGWSGDSGFSSSTAGGGNHNNNTQGSLRRACSLSDLTHATSTPKKIMPNPTTSGGRKSSGGSKGRAMPGSAAARVANKSNQNQDDQPQGRMSSRGMLPLNNKMTPRALKRKSFLSQAMSTGDIRSYPEDSSSEESSPCEQKNLRNRAVHYGGRSVGGGPVRAASERDLTRDISRSSNVRTGGLSRVSPRRQVSASDLSRPSSAASTVDLSPEDFSSNFPFDLEGGALNPSVVESICEWAIESCERLSQLWWRLSAETSEGGASGDEQQQHRALRTLMVGAAARAQHALSPLSGAVGGASAGAGVAGLLPGGAGEKDPRVVTMMQQYTDMLVNMVQQKMAAATVTQTPGPT